MTNVDSQRIKEIRDNTRAMAEAFGRIADVLAEALELYVSTQTETQNSNLTFEKDECAKEYEELGLKELKGLINADRKTEPNLSEYPTTTEDCSVEMSCVDCKYAWWGDGSYACSLPSCKYNKQTDCAWK